MFIKPVHFLNLDNQSAPDCVSDRLNFQNFPEPLVVRPFAAQLGRYAPKLYPPASLSSISTSLKRKTQLNAKQSKETNSFLICFIG